MNFKGTALGLLFFVGASFFSVNAQNFSDLDKSPMDAVMARNEDNSSLVRIIYSRPYKRNRNIFGELVPYGEVWRTGANETTEIRFYEHCLVNGYPIRKGTYGLFSIPGEKEWTLIINANYKGWGAYAYSKEDDILRFQVPALQTATTVEQFSVSTRPSENGASILLGWDTTYLRFEITPKPDLFPEEAEKAEHEAAEEVMEQNKPKKKRKKFLWIF